MQTIVIIGAGASGIMTALNAKNSYNKVILIEKNKVIGQKLSITGSGRCNITNLDTKEDFFSNIPENKKFFYSAFSQFSNYDLIDYLENINISLKYEENKVYPKNESAQKLVNTLLDLLNQKNIEINLNEELTDFYFKIEDGVKKIKSIKTNKKIYDVDYLIFATGGLSYCKNHTFSLLRKKQINITELFPSLVGIDTITNFSSLSGISIKNTTVTAKIDNKSYTINGDIIFTQKGISGPAIMNITSYIIKFQDIKPVSGKEYIIPHNNVETVKYKGKTIEISIDLLPNIDRETLEKIIFNSSKKHIKTKLSSYLPERLSKFLFEKFDNTDLNNLKKEEKNEIISKIKNFNLKIKKFGSIQTAIVTKGGVDLKHISPSTMQFKDVENLYFVGECLNIDALTGGYNLQIAFSTGYVAGNHINKKSALS